MPQIQPAASALPNPKLLPVRAAAASLGLSVRTIWRLIARGDLEVVRIGSAVRVTAKSIDTLIERGGVS